MRKSVKLGAVAVGAAACLAVSASGAWAGGSSAPSPAPATVTSASQAGDGPSTQRYIGTIGYYIAAARYGVIYISGTAFYFYTNHFPNPDATYTAGELVTFDFKVNPSGPNEAINVHRFVAP